MAAAPLEVVLHSLELNREGHYKLNVTVFSTNGERHFRRVSLSSVSYFEPTSAALESVDPVTEANCTLNLVPRSKASRRDTPVFITLDILERTPSLEHDLRITQVQIDLQIRVCKKSLVEQAGKGDFDYYNILLLGPLDSAKSSFVNSVCTMLSKAVKMVATVGGGADCTTTRILRYDLRNIDGPNVRLIDTFGITSDSYSKGVSLDGLIRGDVPLNASKDDPAERLVRPGKVQKVQIPSSHYSSHWQVHRRSMHSAIIFVSSEFLESDENDDGGENDDDDGNFNDGDNDDDQQALENAIKKTTRQAIEKAIQETTAQRLNPILVLAKVDLIKNDLDSQCLRLSRKFGVPRSSVFPLESYVTDNILDFRKDHMTYCILEEAILRARELCDHYKEVTPNHY